MNYSIKKATIEDIPQLIECRIEFVKEGNDNVSKDELDNYCKHLEKYFLKHIQDGSFISWIAVDDKQNIIATSGLEIQLKIPQLWNLPGKESYILNMYTKPKWRRKGIGSVLLEKLLEESKINGINIVSLHASDIGRLLYEKYGFKPNHHYMFKILD